MGHGKVTVQVKMFIEEKGLLDEFQAGYRTNHGTQTALLKLTDDIRVGITNKKVTLLLLFDYSKAFNTVYHVRKISAEGEKSWLLSAHFLLV